MGSIADRLSGKQKERLVTSSLSEGEVFRMHLGDEENVKGKNSGDDGRNKYFIIIGHDSEGNAIGFVLIDTQINPYLPDKRKDMHYPLSAKNILSLRESIALWIVRILKSYQIKNLLNCLVKTA